MNKVFSNGTSVEYVGIIWIERIGFTGVITRYHGIIDGEAYYEVKFEKLDFVVSCYGSSLKEKARN